MKRRDLTSDIASRGHLKEMSTNLAGFEYLIVELKGILSIADSSQRRKVSEIDEIEGNLRHWLDDRDRKSG